jgi:hypothetical protein
MSLQLSLSLTSNATSSLVSVGGPMPCNLPDGQRTDPSGPVAAHASLSARQAKERGLLTSGTYGQRSFGSSASVALRQSLVSKLHQAVPLDGGILFRLTWKERVTPAGQTIYALRASGRSTSGNASTGWPTPLTADVNLSRSSDPYAMSVREMNRPNSGSNLAITAQALALWSTPQAKDTKGGYSHRWVENVHGRSLNDQVMLVSWPTPKASDGVFSTPRTSGRPMEKSTHLQTIAKLVPWPTPAARDWKSSASNKHGDNARPLNEVARLTHGNTPSGSPAETAKPGQLNPAFSRWLMGYPPIWCVAAILAYRQMKRRKPEL